MRPRGDTQRRYNEAIQSLSGKKTEIPTPISNKIVMKKSPLNLTERRSAFPQTVLKLWAAMKYIRQQKQISNLTRLSIYMKNKHSMSTEDVENALRDAVKDGLITSKTVVGNKGSKIGVEQEGYRVPQDLPENDGHDWYCFVCHREGGEVALCSTCYRVFHEDCIDHLPTSSTFICDICKPQEEKFQVSLMKKEINELLFHTCVRLKEKTRELHRIPSPNEEKDRHDFFVYNSMDLCTMENKVRRNMYHNLTEFFNDALQVVHNVIIFYGESTRNTALARQMIRDCEYDLREIEQCPHCYRWSNQKTLEPEWFCQPCTPPHELVFAKTKGYPFWPSKVLRVAKENGGKIYYVRFFGARHYRGSVNEENVKPITTPLQEMGLKKTVPLNRALAELSKHQSLVAKKLAENANKTPVKTPVNGKRKIEEEVITIDDSPERSPTECILLSDCDSVVIQRKSRGRPPRKHNIKSLTTGKMKSKNVSKVEIRERKSRSLVKERVIKRAGRRSVIKRDIKSVEAKVKKQTSYDSESRESSVTPVPKRRKIQRELFNHSLNSPKTDTSLTNVKDGQAEEQNVVSSSQEITVTFSSAAIQTEPYVFSDTEIAEMRKDELPEPKKIEEKLPCNCAIEYSNMLQKMKEKLEKEYQENKKKALTEFTEKLKVEMQIEREKIIQQNEDECMKYRQKMATVRKRTEDELQVAHEAEVQRLRELHQAEISATKKKQWCYNCEKEAIYHCCWNTAYCTVECQQVHWHEGHKKTCRRPRNR